MSGAYSINRPREFDWNLREGPEERAARAVAVRWVYFRADPDGWDGRRLAFVRWLAETFRCR